jgi:hypothetical protein
MEIGLPPAVKKAKISLKSFPFVDRPSGENPKRRVGLSYLNSQKLAVQMVAFLASS